MLFAAMLASLAPAPASNDAGIIFVTELTPTVVADTQPAIDAPPIELASAMRPGVIECKPGECDVPPPMTKTVTTCTPNRTVQTQVVTYTRTRFLGRLRARWRGC